MRDRVPAIAAWTIALVAALAGCADSGGPDDAAGDGAAGESGGDGGASARSGAAGGAVEAIAVERWTGSLTGAGACTEEAGSNMAGSFSPPERISVFGNRSAVLVEVAWPEPQGACVVIEWPHGQEASIVSAPGADAQVRHVVEGPDDGVWSVVVYAHGPSVIDYDGALSAFFGPVPDGYSAFDG